MALHWEILSNSYKAVLIRLILYCLYNYITVIYNNGRSPIIKYISNTNISKDKKKTKINKQIYLEYIKYLHKTATIQQIKQNIEMIKKDI